MRNGQRKYKQAFVCPLLLLLPAWILMPLTGCGGDRNIPSAGILASGRVRLSWNDVPGGAGYHVYMSRTPGVTVFNSLKIANVSNPITITDLEPGITYYFVVAVENDSGQPLRSKEKSITISTAEGSIEFGDILNRSEAPEEITEPTSALSTPASDRKPAAEPGVGQQRNETDAAMAPGKLPDPAAKASDAETRDVTLAWDDVPNVTSYNIYWRDEPGVTRKNGTKIANVKNPHRITGLKKGKTYYFVVTAVNVSGESQESEEFSFTVGQ